MLSLISQRTLLILDGNFNAWQVLLGIRDAGNQFLLRAKDVMKGALVSVLGPGDRLIEMTIPRALRGQLPLLPKTVVVREIRVRLGGKSSRFFTSLLDVEAYSAVELVFRYAERWQEEIAIEDNNAPVRCDDREPSCDLPLESFSAGSSRSPRLGRGLQPDPDPHDSSSDQVQRPSPENRLCR